MLVLLVKVSEISRMILMLLVFVFVLACAYYFSRWYAKSGFVRPKTKNLEVMECFSIGPGKQIQIVRIGNRYYAIGITKERISKIAEIPGEELDFSPTESVNINFQDVFHKIQQKNKDRKNRMDGK